MAKVRFINPSKLAKPPSYSHLVEVTGPVRTVFIAGQLGTDRNGEVVGPDFRAQAEQVYDNLKTALAEVGATFKDVVKVNSYVSDMSNMPALRDVRAKYLNADALPASTSLQVSGFARPVALLEIEMVAVLPMKTVKTRVTKTRAAKTRAAKPKAARRKRK